MVAEGVLKPQARRVGHVRKKEPQQSNQQARLQQRPTYDRDQLPFTNWPPVLSKALAPQRPWHDTIPSSMWRAQASSVNRAEIPTTKLAASVEKNASIPVSTEDLTDDHRAHKDIYSLAWRRPAQTPPSLSLAVVAPLAARQLSILSAPDTRLQISQCSTHTQYRQPNLPAMT